MLKSQRSTLETDFSELQRSSTDLFPSETGENYVITPNHLKPLETVLKKKKKKEKSTREDL